MLAGCELYGSESAAQVGIYRTITILCHSQSMASKNTAHPKMNGKNIIGLDSEVD